VPFNVTTVFNELQDFNNRNYTCRVNKIYMNRDHASHLQVSPRLFRGRFFSALHSIFANTITLSPSPSEVGDLDPTMSILGSTLALLAGALIAIVAMRQMLLSRKPGFSI
jgi:hypothetical protein